MAPTKRRKSPANKGQKLPPEPLTDDEVRALINTCSPSTSTGIRNRALLAVLYRAGLRVSEALNLHSRDLDAKAGTIHVRHGKGDKSRRVGLDNGAFGILQLWLERRQTLGIRKNAPVFCTFKGEAIETAYVRALFKRLGAKAGIEKRVHPHGLRHTLAFQLANEGTAIHVIQAQLGHSNLGTTDRYIRHLNPKAVVDAMKARTWSL